jgi:hypothetical protein
MTEKGALEDRSLTMTRELHALKSRVESEAAHVGGCGFCSTALEGTGSHGTDSHDPVVDCMDECRVCRSGAWRSG